MTSDIERKWLTITQAAARHAVSKQHLFNEWNAHRLTFKNKGRGKRAEYIVSVEEMDRWAAELPTATPKGRAS